MNKGGGFFRFLLLYFHFKMDSEINLEQVKEIKESFKHLNKPLAKTATNRIAKDFSKMKTAKDFIKLTEYLNALPDLERRYIIMHLLTGTMTLYSKGLHERLAREDTKGLYV